MKYQNKDGSCWNTLFSKSCNGLVLKVCLVLFLTALLLNPATLYAVENSTAKHPSGAELEAVFQNFEQYAEKNMKESEIPGMAIAIFKDDKIIYSKAFGVKTIGKTEPVTANTLFQIGSTSKAFTAAMVAMLVDEGKLDWNDRLIDHLPDFKMYDPWVTREFRVKDLMAQRSGMPGYSGDIQVFLGYDRVHIYNAINIFSP